MTTAVNRAGASPRRAGTLGLAAALIAVGIGAQVATANTIVGPAFVSPTKNVVCWNADTEDGRQIGCGVKKTAAPRCDGSVQATWSFTGASRSSSGPRVRCEKRFTAAWHHRLNTLAPVLAYGQSRVLGRGIRCTSRKTGLTCVGPGGRAVFNDQSVRVVRERRP